MRLRGKRDKTSLGISGPQLLHSMHNRLVLYAELFRQEGYIWQLRRLDEVIMHCSAGIKRRVAPFTFNQTLPIRSDYNRISKIRIVFG